MDCAAFFDELEKLGAISDEEAAASRRRLEVLEGKKPTVHQVARYAAIGALAKPAIGALGAVIKGGRREGIGQLGHLVGAKAPGTGAALRSLAERSATGALSAGAIPLVRTHFDRKAEQAKLKAYEAQAEKR
jgi:hypothetical protein